MIKIKQNKLFLITLLSLAGILATWLLYVYLLNINFDLSQDKVRSEVIKWNYDISDRIYKKQDLGFVEKKIDDLGTQHLASYEIKIKGEHTSFLKWPEKKAQIDGCRPYSEALSISSGIQIGNFNFCVSNSRVIRATIISVEFLVPLILMIFGIIHLSSRITLNSYKNGLNYLIDVFGKGQNKESFKKLKYTQDKLTNRVVSYIKKSFDSELDLKQTQVELSGEKALKDLSDSVAHDIKKATADIKKHLYLYLKTKRDEDLNRLDRSFQKIDQIYKDVGSEEINKYSMRLNKPELIEINGILKEVVEDQKAAHPSTKIKLIMEKRALKAICHPVELRRSIENLIHNSVEAIEHNKGLVIVTAKKEGVHLVMTVKDNGKGIPESILQYIFEDKFTSGKDGGTGIGLYSVKRKVFSWLGSIDVQSKVGVGSTFTIKLKNEESFKITQSENMGEMNL